jgi:hypothetical protein
MGLFTLKRGDPTRQWVRAAAAAARQIADNRPAHRARRRIHTKPGTACCALCSAGPPSRARALLDKALGLSLAARSTRSVTLCLAALARWALVAGDPRAGSAGGGGGRGPAPAGRAAGVADATAGRGRPGGPGPAGAAPTISTSIRHRHPATQRDAVAALGPAPRQYLTDGITGNSPVVRRLAPMSAPAGPAVSAEPQDGVCAQWHRLPPRRHLHRAVARTAVPPWCPEPLCRVSARTPESTPDGWDNGPCYKDLRVRNPTGFRLAGDHHYEVEVRNDIDELVAVALSVEGLVALFSRDPPVPAVSLREVRCGSVWRGGGGYVVGWNDLFALPAPPLRYRRPNFARSRAGSRRKPPPKW